MTIILLAALASLQAWAEAPGRAVFDGAGCRACHRIGERGGNAGPDLTLVGMRRSPEWLSLWLQFPRAWKHDTRMPDFRLKPGDLRVLVSYLSSLRGQDWPKGPPWKPLKSPPLPPAGEGRGEGENTGRVIFNRAGCVACHGPAGAGGHPNNNVPGGAIPPLPALAATYTVEELMARISQGKKPDKADPLGPEPFVAMPAWRGVLDDVDLRNVAEYVKSLGASAPKSDW